MHGNVMSEGVFVHIPRTGGLGIRSTHNFSRIWHSYGSPAPTSCNVITSLRNETDRYCSEWNFYGRRFFAQGKSVKGWAPKSHPMTFESFARDKTTHNTMVRILSGCQMYDNECRVTEATVDSILKRIECGCIRLVTWGRAIVHANPHSCSRDERRTAYRVNALDRLLLERINRHRARRRWDTARCDGIVPKIKVW